MQPIQFSKRLATTKPSIFFLMWLALLGTLPLALPTSASADSDFTVTVNAGISPTTIYNIGNTTQATGSASATIVGNNPGAAQELQTYKPTPTFSIVSVKGTNSGDTLPSATINSNGSNLAVTAASNTTGDTYTVTIKADYAWLEGKTPYDESGTTTVTVTVVAITASFGSQPPSRIPISGKTVNQYKINVTISPSPLPAAIGPVAVSVAGSSGSASVTPTSLSSSGTVTLTGTANSTAANALTLQLTCASAVLATSSPFTVSTHPTGLTLTEYSKNDGFGISALQNWTSESGNVADLGNCLQDETFPSEYRQNPPFTQDTNKNTSFFAIQSNDVDEHDYHSVAVNYTGSKGTFTATQNYVWYDRVLGSPSTPIIIFNDTITRTVNVRTSTTYYFTTAISGGFSDSCSETGP